MSVGLLDLDLDSVVLYNGKCGGGWEIEMRGLDIRLGPSLPKRRYALMVMISAMHIGTRAGSLSRSINMRRRDKISWGKVMIN